MFSVAAAMATSAAHADKPHLLFFPLPFQGHVTPALQLAKLLHHWHGFQITFVHTERNRRRLLDSRGAGALAGIPGFRFVVVPDGLLPSEGDALQEMVALLFSLENFVPHFRNLVSELLPPVTFVISDIEQILRSTKEMGLRSVALCTVSACGFMAFQQCQQIVDKGIVPFKDVEQLRNDYLDSTIVDWVPGMPKDMRLSDFPSFIRTTEHDGAFLSMTLRLMECYRTIPSAVIFHTFDDLESQVMAAMPTILPPCYAVGPLPLLLNHVAAAAGSSSDTMGSNLLQENHGCMEWLAGKRPNSVVYVSFGSIAALTKEQLVEFAWGLANSGHDFLWAVRNEQVMGGRAAAALPLPPEFWEETRARGHVTSWCPQAEVLLHEAVGAFLTHCGWISMLESICAGVPMVCWPLGADQQTNSRFACSEWRVGVELRGNAGRDEVRTAIAEAMEGDKGEEMKRMAMEWKEKATLAALPGGASWVNLHNLVNEVLCVKHAS